MNTLQLWRDQLDQIDDQLVQLLNERIKIARNIAELKEENSFPLSDQAREQEVIHKALDEAENPLLKEYIPKIFEPIMECSKAIRIFSRPGAFPFKRIGVIGMGLMGGSLCKALKANNSEITLLALKTDEYCDEWNEVVDKVTDLRSLTENSELIILATPISTIIPLAKEICMLMRSTQNSLIVMDIASVKKELVDEFEKLSNDRLEFVGTHPMAGSERIGFEHSQATLFMGASWMMTPHPKNSQVALMKIESLISALGSKPIILDAEKHDQWVALISHLPGIISGDIFNFVQQVDRDCLKIAGPGFKSMTRLAKSNPQLREEIAVYNKNPIKKTVKLWIDYLIKQRGQS